MGRRGCVFPDGNMGKKYSSVQLDDWKVLVLYEESFSPPVTWRQFIRLYLEAASLFPRERFQLTVWMVTLLLCWRPNPGPFLPR